MKMTNSKKVVFLFYLAVLPFSSGLKAQIDSVKYLLQYNPGEDVFDMYIYIAGGKATSVLQRTATNTQVSVLVPTGASLDIVNRYMPLQNNQNYNGTKANDWSKGHSVKSPAVFPQYDIYSIVPVLSPASQYNNLNSGDTVKLFSLKIKLATGCFGDVKLFDKSLLQGAPGIEGADFSQGITIGGTKPLFKGILSSTSPHVNQRSFHIAKQEEISLTSSIANTGQWAFWSEDTGLELNNISPGVATVIATDLALKEYTLICQNDSITDIVCVSIQESSGTKKDLFSSPLLIYPNPAFDVIHVDESDYDKLEIRDMSGTVIWKTNQKVNMLDISSWPSGLYMVHCKNGKQTRYSKFSKQ